MFPLSNWTEIDVWNYIHVENIPIVPMYFAKEREVIVRGTLAHRPGAAVRRDDARREATGREVPHALARLLALHGRDQVRRRHRCPKIIEELIATRQSERQLRIIDHDQDGSMELKKREGYF